MEVMVAQSGGSSRWPWRPGWALTSLAMGCGLGGGLTGSDPYLTDGANVTDGNPGTSPPEMDEICPAEDLEAECGPESRSLTATAGTWEGEPAAQVVHQGVELAGCAPWTATAVPDDAFQLISIHYQPGPPTSDTGTDAACDCAWRFTYWLPLDPGTYTLSALGDLAEVTIP